MSAVLPDTRAIVNHILGLPMKGGANHAIRLAQVAGSVLVPSVAATEVAQKVASRMLHLGGRQITARLWFAEAMRLPGMVERAVTTDVALAAYELPSPFHKDPADRLIVAMARRLGVPVVTSDGRILD